MKLEEYRSRAFAYALEQGCDAAETYYVSGDSLSMNAQDGEIDRYEVSRQAGLSLRVQYEGSDGYAYTEALDDPEQLVRRAMDNAKIIETTDEHPMQGRCTYETVTPAPNPFEGLSEEEMIQKTLRLEKAALTADPSVKRTAVCEVGRGTGHIELHNTRGLAAVRDVSEGYCAVETILGKNGTLKTGYAVRVGTEAAKLGACAKAAVREGLEKFGASTVPSGEYRILLKNTAASDLLRAFMPVFSADEAQKGCSLLAGREGQTVGSEKISIVDDPFHPVSPRAFDGEGTPCRRKDVVENGVLKTLLHNLKTARKAGVKSTGNARRASAASPVGIGPTVFYVVPGKSPYSALVKRLKNGLVITSLEGLHAGLHPVSGDFSLKAEGFLVEDGRIVRPVSEITVAGNFLTLLQDTQAVGSDLKFPYAGADYVASPSLLLRRLAVAGG